MRVEFSILEPLESIQMSCQEVRDAKMLTFIGHCHVNAVASARAVL